MRATRRARRSRGRCTGSGTGRTPATDRPVGPNGRTCRGSGMPSLRATRYASAIVRASHAFRLPCRTMAATARPRSSRCFVSSSTEATGHFASSLPFHAVTTCVAIFAQGPDSKSKPDMQRPAVTGRTAAGACSTEATNAYHLRAYRASRRSGTEALGAAYASRDRSAGLRPLRFCRGFSLGGLRR